MLPQMYFSPMMLARGTPRCVLAKHEREGRYTCREKKERPRSIQYHMHHVDPHGSPVRHRVPRGTVAFWVKDDLAIENDKSHVEVIIDDPERFGLTREEVERAYERRQDKLSSEGR